jgi:hypothetical protein
MLRSVFFAVGLAGAVAATHPVLADPVAAPMPDHTQIAAPTTVQPTSPAAVRSSSPDAIAPETAGSGKTMIAVGFGWG